MCSVDPLYILYLIWLLIEKNLVTIAKFHEIKLCECTHAIMLIVSKRKLFLRCDFTVTCNFLFDLKST